MNSINSVPNRVKNGLVNKQGQIYKVLLILVIFGILLKIYFVCTQDVDEFMKMSSKQKKKWRYNKYLVKSLDSMNKLKKEEISLLSKLDHVSSYKVGYIRRNMIVTIFQNSDFLNDGLRTRYNSLKREYFLKELTSKSDNELKSISDDVIRNKKIRLRDIEKRIIKGRGKDRGRSTYRDIDKEYKFPVTETGSRDPMSSNAPSTYRR